jgi:hypothetical protein
MDRSKGRPRHAGGSIIKKVKMVRKLTPTGHKVGRVIVVTSQFEGRGQIPSNIAVDNDSVYLSPSTLSRPANFFPPASRQVWNLDYDLSSIPADHIHPWTEGYQNLKSRKGRDFIRVKLDLDITVTQLDARVGAKAQLIWGRTEGFQGGQGAPGMLLAWKDIQASQPA